MADIYLHSRLSEEVVKDIDYNFNMNIVFIAAQGPDPMYYNALSKDAKEYRFYADRMHDTNTRLLFKNMVTYVKNHLNKDTYSFLVGFICHYALDVSIHPYVYHNVGVYKKDDPSTHSYRGLHLKFERSIDAAMIEKELRTSARKLNLHKKYFVKTNLNDDVTNIVGHVLKNTYAKDSGAQMYQIAVSKMYKNVKYMIKDRFGIKKQLYKIIDLFDKGDMFYKDLSFFNHLEEYDYLNESKTTWYHPITNEPSNLSVEEMFENARVFAHSLIKQVNPYLFDDKTIELENIFTNLSFNSGLDCDIHEPMKYFNIYRK